METLNTFLRSYTIFFLIFNLYQGAVAIKFRQGKQITQDFSDEWDLIQDIGCTRVLKWQRSQAGYISVFSVST